MDFFKRKVNESSKEETKLVGAVVPTNIFHYLNLFCVVDSRSKSSIIKPLIEDWYSDAIEDFPKNKLIKLAAEMGYESYLNRSNRKRPFAAVIKQQEKELLKKGIMDIHVTAIIQKIKQLHESKKN